MYVCSMYLITDKLKLNNNNNNNDIEAFIGPGFLAQIWLDLWP